MTAIKMGGLTSGPWGYVTLVDGTLHYEGTMVEQLQRAVEQVRRPGMTDEQVYALLTKTYESPYAWALEVESADADRRSMVQAKQETARKRQTGELP